MRQKASGDKVLRVSETTQDNQTTKDAGLPAQLDGLTPAMRQYVEQKRRVGDAVLLFRMGDFYETFYQDAILCSKVLGIALTARNKADDPIPLAGIPYHALNGYLSKLVNAGYKVAISEQLEDPKEAKGVVRRDVVRIVTAGTLTEDSLLKNDDDNTLACICLRSEVVGLATVELASGRFEVVDGSRDEALSELVKLKPAELLIDDEHGSETTRLGEEAKALCGVVLSRRPLHEFSSFQAEKSLKKHFGVSTLAGFGEEEITPALCAAGCAIQYLNETQKSVVSHISSMSRRTVNSFVQLDHNTWRALEIDRTLRGGEREGSLLSTIDRTVNPIGARRLRHWLRAPLRDAGMIDRRQDAVSCLVHSDLSRSRVRKILKSMADVERIATRIAMSRCSPRDLRALGVALSSLPILAKEIEQCRIAILADIAESFAGMEELADLLSRAIKEEPANTLHEGGIIEDGFDEELDRLRGLGRNAQEWLANYQKREVERTGITSLKVGFNRVFGYYLEITNTYRDQAPPEYVRKQTLKNAERYITDELKQFETEVLSSQERANEREYRLFEQVRLEVAHHVERLKAVAGGIGDLDCLAALAELAVHRRYVRPEFVDAGLLRIEDGRHPVLDQLLADTFVPNDTHMKSADTRVYVITGPNMAGKSTYIRQVALLCLLAQTGSFVPARSMQLSPVDRIFARVGASDELARGQSTFMVEMTESANILHNATADSLVVLDELGRGTSTFDGLSLAWAITEHLVRVTRCRTFVATHYHELTELANILEGVKNYNVSVREIPGASESEDGIAFLHRIVEGGASKSYGVHVARLAGVPKPVIERAREVLDELQDGFSRETKAPSLSRHKKQEDQLMLFHGQMDDLARELCDVDPNQITPMEALSRLKAWKEQYGV